MVTSSQSSTGDITYPSGIDTTKEKLAAVYRLLEELRLEHNKQGAIAKANWPQYQARWQVYAKEFRVKQAELLREQNYLRDTIRHATYTNIEWSAMDESGWEPAKVAMWGDKTILKEQPTTATSVVLTDVKAMKV